MALASCPARQGQQRSLHRDVPGFELGVGALAGSAQPGAGMIGGFLRGGLVPITLASDKTEANQDHGQQQVAPPR